jgi:membrane protease YdiL (CAAX protease family)
MSYLDYARRGANSPLRYGLGVTLTLALTIAIGVALTVVLQIFHLLPANFAAMAQDASHPETFYPVTAVVFLLLLIGCMAAARIVHGKRPGDIFGDWRWSAFAGGFLLWLVVVVAGALIDYLITPAGFSITLSRETPKLALLALGGLAIQTLAEEFIFRGYLTQGLLLAIKRPLPTALVSGMIFGAVHIPNGIPQAANATLFGIVMALLAIRMRGIAFTYGLHLANNFAAAVVLVSSNDVFHGSPAIFTQNTPRLMWWDAVVGTLGLVLVAAWMLRPRRQAGPAPQT